MFGKFLKKPKQIKFFVDGKPPKKKQPSMWSIDSKQTQSVLDIRQIAYDVMKKEGLEKFQGPVKLTLTVYNPNPAERKDRHDYHGDLDSLIQGVFDSLQPSPPENNKLIIHPMLKETKEIRHDVALVMADDAQITTTVSKKRKNEKPFYTVLIEKDDDFE
jgi:Holliday junction resolvase RusA-like endonuclease